MPLTAAEICQAVAGELVGEATLILHGIAPANAAREGFLTFAETPAYFAAAAASPASAILCHTDAPPCSKTLIRVAQPRVAMARLLPLFFPPEPVVGVVHPSASIHPTAVIDPSACIGPGCVVGAGVRIGARTHLNGGNHIGQGCRIGDDVQLLPNVVLYPRTQIGHRVAIHAGTVIGSDGYGYVLDEGRHRKILHLGNVVIGDDVEIGANAAIDRGVMGPTMIGEGSKIDNLVHVAHNVTVGKHCLILGQVGFGGSTRLGDYCVVASQAGIADHLKLGTQSRVGAKSGVMRDVPDGETVVGIPAQPDGRMKRQWVGMQQLPELMKRMRALEKQVATLAGSVGVGGG